MREKTRLEAGWLVVAGLPGPNTPLIMGQACMAASQPAGKLCSKACIACLGKCVAHCFQCRLPKTRFTQGACCPGQ